MTVLTMMVAGCGSNGPPPQSTDPEALKREATEGKQLRDRLEGGSQPEK
jgi:hypothetical protein